MDLSGLEGKSRRSLVAASGGVNAEFPRGPQGVLPRLGKGRRPFALRRSALRAPRCIPEGFAKVWQKTAEFAKHWQNAVFALDPAKGVCGNGGGTHPPKEEE